MGVILHLEFSATLHKLAMCKIAPEKNTASASPCNPCNPCQIKAHPARPYSIASMEPREALSKS